MNYFAMIHWSDKNLTPVLNDDGMIELWETYEEAKAAIMKMDIYNSRDITIHDTSGDQ